MILNPPCLTLSEFSDRLVDSVPENLLGNDAVLWSSTLQALYAHYTTLCQWNPSASLIGPGTRSEIVERHYGESLAGLALIPRATRTIVDLGSGAGFPGFVLAAARLDLRVTLVEPRQRKWAFLKTACRRASLSCRLLNARVGATLPEGFPESVDLVTVRALRLTSSMLRALRPRLSSRGVILLWGGMGLSTIPDDVVEVDSVRLPKSTQRRIIKLEFVDS